MTLLPQLLLLLCRAVGLSAFPATAEVCPTPPRLAGPPRACAALPCSSSVGAEEQLGQPGHEPPGGASPALLQPAQEPSAPQEGGLLGPGPGPCPCPGASLPRLRACSRTDRVLLLLLPRLGAAALEPVLQLRMLGRHRSPALAARGSPFPPPLLPATSPSQSCRLRRLCWECPPDTSSPTAWSSSEPSSDPSSSASDLPTLPPPSPPHHSPPARHTQRTECLPCEGSAASPSCARSSSSACAAPALA